MFCTDEERNTCQVEKMGCEGCFYNNEKYNKKSFMKRFYEKYLIKRLENLIKFPKPRLCISVKDIKIKDEFIKRPPSKKKMSQKWRYYRETGKLNSPIILDENLYLVDGYTSYLIAIADGIKTVDIKIRKEQ
jgi:hypothetical protein